MTNLEAILEDLRPYPVRRATIERKCIKYNLDIAEPVTDEVTVTKIVIEILSQMVYQSVSEGGESYSFDKELLKNRIECLCAEIGWDASKFVTIAQVKRLE